MSHLKPTGSLPSFSRRTLIRGALAAGLASTGAGSLVACGGGGGSSSGGGTVGGEVTLGVYQGDEVPRKAMQAMIDGYAHGSNVKINFVDHETFKNNINNYLQGNPDDLFTWFAGYRGDLAFAALIVGGGSSEYAVRMTKVMLESLPPDFLA